MFLELSGKIALCFPEKKKKKEMTLKIPISPLDSPTKEVVIYFSIGRDLGGSQKISHSPGLSHLMRTHEGLIYKLMQREKVAADKLYFSL